MRSPCSRKPYGRCPSGSDSPDRFPTLRPTSFGLKAIAFYVAVVGAYFASPYVNLFFLLLAFLTIQWGLALAWSWRSTRGVEVRIEELPVIAAGESARVHCKATPRAGRRFAVEVELVLERASDARRARILRGGAALVADPCDLFVEIPPLTRGVHEVANAFVTSVYPFGLLRRRRSVPGPKEIVVYPKPTTRALAADCRGVPTADDWIADLIGPGQSGDLQPSSLRDKRSGESLRAVHWRASARRRKLVVQEWEGGRGEGLEVALDRRADPEVFERALSDLAAIVVVARTSKEILAVRTQGLSETFGEGHSSWNRLLKFLAATTPLPQSAAGPPPVSPSTPTLPRQEMARV